jgi:hypothetical protein
MAKPDNKEFPMSKLTAYGKGNGVAAIFACGRQAPNHGNGNGCGGSSRRGVSPR